MKQKFRSFVSGAGIVCFFCEIVFCKLILCFFKFVKGHLKKNISAICSLGEILCNQYNVL